MTNTHTCIPYGNWQTKVLLLDISLHKDMGNVNNIWYYKGDGGSWCDTACGLDRDYRMPFRNGDTRYLQVNYPSEYTSNRVWLADLEGNRLVNILETAEYNRTVGEDFTVLSFLIPAFGEGDCPTYQGTELRCLFDIVAYLTFLGESFIGLYESYLAGTDDVTVSVEYNGGTPYFLPALPVGWSDAPDDLFYIPCPPDGAINVDIRLDFYINNVLNTTTDVVPIEYISEVEATIDIPINCFRFEVPLLDGEGTEVGTLLTEPFECGGCTPTVVLYGDYCRAVQDIDRDKVFDLTTLEGTVTGTLMAITNEMRVQAVLKRLPSTSTQTRNVKCNNFKSKKTKQFKIQGADTDFPPYMAAEMESLFSAKKLYVDGVEYVGLPEQIFLERGVLGYSMWKLEAVLTECERSVAFDCSCAPPPINCDDNPVTGFMGILPAPAWNNDGIGYFGVDQSYIRAEIFGLTGGVGVVTISDWQSISDADPVMADVAGTDITAFDDTRLFNFFRRTTYDPCDGCYTVLAKATDERGCIYQLGNTVDKNDIRCVEQDGSFEIGTVTSTTIEVINILPNTGANVEYSLDGLSWSSPGIPTPGPVTIPGLTPNTEYGVHIRLACSPTLFIYGLIGPEYVTTLP